MTRAVGSRSLTLKQLEAIRDGCLAGMTHSQVAAKLSVSRSTISTFLKRWRRDGGIYKKSSSGRPRVTSEAMDKKIISIFRKNPSYTYADMLKEIKITIGVAPSRYTIRRRLQKAGLPELKDQQDKEMSKRVKVEQIEDNGAPTVKEEEEEKEDSGATAPPQVRKKTSGATVVTPTVPKTGLITVSKAKELMEGLMSNNPEIPLKEIYLALKKHGAKIRTKIVRQWYYKEKKVKKEESEKREGFPDFPEDHSEMSASATDPADIVDIVVPIEPADHAADFIEAISSSDILQDVERLFQDLDAVVYDEEQQLGENDRRLAEESFKEACELYNPEQDYHAEEKEAMEVFKTIEEDPEQKSLLETDTFKVDDASDNKANEDQQSMNVEEEPIKDEGLIIATNIDRADLKDLEREGTPQQEEIHLGQEYDNEATIILEPPIIIEPPRIIKWRAKERREEEERKMEQERRRIEETGYDDAGRKRDVYEIVKNAAGKEFTKLKKATKRQLSVEEEERLCAEGTAYCQKINKEIREHNRFVINIGHHKTMLR